MSGKNTFAEEFSGCYGCYSFFGLVLIGSCVLKEAGCHQDTATHTAFWVVIVIFAVGYFFSIINRVTGKGPYYKVCPQCRERVDVHAQRCPYCQCDLSKSEN
ncbi:MAG: hypothetical protein D6820_11340 [Lentisphaerae bacterium]|nr:MAG: hypothetical protein D6820_11340 [Lentisphaerota bacterium]